MPSYNNSYMKACYFWVVSAYMASMTSAYFLATADRRSFSVGPALTLGTMYISNYWEEGVKSIILW